jgi:hypothetical protein
LDFGFENIPSGNPALAWNSNRGFSTDPSVLTRNKNVFTAGLPDFSWYNIPKRGKIHQMTTYNTKWPKIYLMVGKLTKLPQNIPTSSIVRPSKIYPNWNFWFENIPSGNPA